MPDLKPLLRDFEPHELPAVLTGLGEPGYRGRQLAKWLFQDGAFTWEQMTNLPTTLRQRLATTHDLQALQPSERIVASDGTRKYLFTLRDAETIESVLIPMENHATFCVSSQVGCAMACRFCATAHGGLVRQLTPGEILEQIVHLQADLSAHPLPGHGQRQFNIVFMGMGEPLDNWPAVNSTLNSLTAKNGFAISARRITLSTSGHRSGLDSVLTTPNLKVGLTISVCGISEERRLRLMPVAGRYSLAELLEQAAQYTRRIKRRITLAYILIADVSDQLEEA
ncbi:MAG: 23S rRNA (adenine(2503)-C(2))-methyltransferase RlmN, partial [bacterium]